MLFYEKLSSLLKLKNTSHTRVSRKGTFLHSPLARIPFPLQSQETYVEICKIVRNGSQMFSFVSHLFDNMRRGSWVNPSAYDNTIL